MSRTNSRCQLLLEHLAQRVLVLDGAMGTSIQARGLGPEDFGGPEYEGCNEYLVLTRPDVIREIHASFLQAGADIIETDTFGSTALVMREFGLEERAFEVTRRAAQLAREMADAASTPSHPRFVAGSMGPTTKALSVTGGIDFRDLQAAFREQARALLQGGVDYLLLETCQDTRNIKAALLGIEEVFEQEQRRLPLAVSVTIEPTGTMLAGQSVEALLTSLEHLDLLYLGLNCATGPEFMTDHLRALAELARTRVACVPNAGLPDEEGTYLETPRMIAAVLARFLDEGWLNLVGGCCGTRPEHIREMVRLVGGCPPRSLPSYRRTFLSGIEWLEVEEENRPVLVGERTNVLGSRRFRRLIQEGRFEEAAEIARRQVRNGAQIIDICLQDPDRDESADMRLFLDQVVRRVKVPLMIDSTDAAVMAEALIYCQGKAVLNSVNLEDGEKRFQEVAALARRFGAALVVGTIDEDPQQGMAVTRQRKLAIARRSYQLLVEKYGLSPTDLFFDPLVFPCATGDAQYLGSARETIEGVRLIKEALPDSKTILGVSNVSFGLPAPGREILNSVFLYHATLAGLDLAIVNTERLERYASISEEDKRLAEAVLFETSEETVAAFVERFRQPRQARTVAGSELPLDERLADYIIEGSKDGLVQDLDLKLKEAPPLEIINGPLMAGMDEVGRLFNNNELIVAEVLQSAEAMKAAVAHLEPFMDQAETSNRGTVLLATVKGDVHDIGKNLVDIVLSNNGYRIVNLGIKVPPHALIEAVRQHRPDAIGLSGLLVKSAQQMVITAQELERAGVSVPLLVGGAALTRNFTRLRIAPTYPGLVLYARDAMDGLDLVARVLDPARREELEEELAQQTRECQRRREEARPPARPRTGERVKVLPEVPAPPDFERHLLRHIPPDEVWPYLNRVMLYGKHMGLKGGVSQRLESGDAKADKLKRLFQELEEECRQGVMELGAVWRFFPALAEGDRVILLDGDGRQAAGEFRFPRQAGEGGLCLSDYVRPAGYPEPDSICLFAVTAGSGIRETYERYRDQGEYLKSHAIQALAVETAEALAEWLHAKLRGLWGFPDPPAMTMQQRLHGAYRGKRYSFGYPACPDLEDQKKLWQLLEPQEIGIQLTEECMMDPEASVSAIVFHHPQAHYFNV